MDTLFIMVLGFLFEVRRGSFSFLLSQIFKLNVCSHLQKTNEKDTGYCQCWEPTWGVEIWGLPGSAEQTYGLVHVHGTLSFYCQAFLSKLILPQLIFRLRWWHISWTVGCKEAFPFAATEPGISCSATTPRALLVFVFPFVLVLTKSLSSVERSWHGV